MAKVLGIDLGTANSRAAVFDHGEPRILASPGGLRAAPSIVAFEDSGLALVGEAASRQALTNCYQTITLITRLLAGR